MPAWSDAGRVGIQITGEKFEPVVLTLLVSAELAKSMEPHAEPKETPAPQPSAAAPADAPVEPPAASAAPPSVPRAASAAPPAPKMELTGGQGDNLELLLDVKLDAAIRFGQKRMLLREVLELHPGTAVALDRLVQDPVELLVGGRVVAQGEVVIIDGNYGIRITEIVSPQQRIESLRK